MGGGSSSEYYYLAKSIQIFDPVTISTSGGSEIVLNITGEGILDNFRVHLGRSNTIKIEIDGAVTTINNGNSTTACELVFDTGKYFLTDPTSADTVAMYTLYSENIIDWIALGADEFYYIKLDPNTTINIGQGVGDYVGKNFIFNNIIYFKNNLKVTIINNYNGKGISRCAFTGLYKPS